MLGFNNTVAAVLAAVLSAGQYSLNSNSECQNAFKGVGENLSSSCLQIYDLVTLALSPANASLIPTTTKWLGGICAASPCSNYTVYADVTTIVGSCSTDLASAGYGSLTAAQAVSYAQKYYPVVREILCSKSNGNFCVTNTLAAFQTAIGQNLSLAALENPAFTGMAESVSNSTPVVCTDCTQTAYALIKQATPDLAGSSFENQLANTCGSNFVDAGEASDVTYPAANGAQAGVPSFGVYCVLASAGMALVGSALAFM